MWFAGSFTMEDYVVVPFDTVLEFPANLRDIFEVPRCAVTALHYSHTVVLLPLLHYLCRFDTPVTAVLGWHFHIALVVRATWGQVK